MIMDDILHLDVCACNTLSFPHAGSTPLDLGCEIYVFLGFGGYEVEGKNTAVCVEGSLETGGWGGRN